MPENFVPCILIVPYVEIKVKYNVPVHIMSAYAGSRDIQFHSLTLTLNELLQFRYPWG